MNVVEAAGIEDAGVAPRERIEAIAAGNRREAADARGRGRTRAVARLATADAEAATAGLVAQVAAAIEATAAEAPWRDLVQLAPGFAEEAARVVVASRVSGPTSWRRLSIEELQTEPEAFAGVRATKGS